MYTIRDIDKALLDKIKAKDFSLILEGKDIRVRAEYGTPDEMISMRRFPGICIESGYQIRTPESWQPDVMVGASIAGISVDMASCRLIDIFYTYKIGFYVTFRPHCTYMEQEFLKLFPNKFWCDVVDYSGNNYKIPFVQDSGLINLDVSKGVAKMERPLQEGELESDLRLYRRDILLTSQIVLEERTVESLLRPYTGILIGISSSVPTIATVAASFATISFVEE
jgi:hypothetical protein